MNLVLLAAGVGSRFKGKFNNKILLKINKKLRIFDIINNSFSNAKIKKKIIVIGHNAKILKKSLLSKNLVFVYNKYFIKRDMLHTLIMGLKISNEDTIISYSDIIYSKQLVEKIMKKKSKDILLPSKTNWKKIWRIRGKLKTNDAESLKYDKNFNLIEIGKKIDENTKGQFMGLLYVPKNKIQPILKIYKKIKIKKMQTTDFLENLIKNKMVIKVFPNNEPWYEFDDEKDLNNFKKCDDKFF